MSFCSLVKIRLNASMTKSTTNSLPPVTEYLLSMSGLPNSQTFTRRVTDTSLRISWFSAPSIRTNLSLGVRIGWVMRKCAIIKSRMFLRTICFSSSKQARIVDRIKVDLFGKLISSVLALMSSSMYFRLSLINPALEKSGFFDGATIFYATSCWNAISNALLEDYYGFGLVSDA